MSNYRTNESPMDWQWDKAGGPSDPASPFAPQNIERQLMRRAEGGPPRKRHFGEVAVTPVKENPYSLGTPVSKPMFFTPYQNSLDSAAFKTPRDFKSPTANSEADDSPAPKVPGMDSEVLTPDVTPTRAISPVKGVTNKNRDPEAYKGVFSAFGISPSKKPAAAAKPHKYSDKAAKRVTRRRQRGGSNGDYWTNSGDSYDDEEEDDPFRSKRNAPKTPAAPAPTRWADSHRDVPQILSQYLQLLVNFVIAMVSVYFFYLIVVAIQRDVEKKVQEYVVQAQVEVEHCHRQWMTNGCTPERRVPAMEERCQAWRVCADMDPYSIGRSKVSAETFAEIVNGFVEPISFKSMGFILALIMGCLFVTNFAFGFFRAKVDRHPAPVLAAAAPRFVDFGDGTGVMHPYPTIFATPSRSKTRGRSRSPKKTDRTPFFTAKKLENNTDYDDEDAEVPSPTVTRKRLGW